MTRDYLKAAVVEAGAYIINEQRMEVLVIPYGEYFPADLIPVLEEMTRAKVTVIFLEDFPRGMVGTDPAL